MSFTEETLDKVREATDLVALVSRHARIYPSTTQTGECPICNSDGPTFHVWPETQTFKCFQCGCGGNAYHFLMKLLGISFHVAVKSLAEEQGIEPEEEA